MTAPFLLDRGVRKVLDFGCGRLRNVPELERLYPSLDVLDTKNQLERVKDLLSKKQLSKFHTWEDVALLKQKFDAIFVISVLHIIPEKNTRRRVLIEADRLLKPGGFLVTDVPQHETYYARRCSAKNAYKDGYVMGDRDHVTFYRNFLADEFDEFVRTTVHYEIAKRVGYTKHLIRIWEKTN